MLNTHSFTKVTKLTFME